VAVFKLRSIWMQLVLNLH